MYAILVFFFFFQAEDGIRDYKVTGVQTCALPIFETLSVVAQVVSYRGFRRRVLRMAPIHHHFEVGGWSEFTVTVRFWLFKIGRARVGKECRSRWSPYH